MSPVRREDTGQFSDRIVEEKKVICRLSRRGSQALWTTEWPSFLLLVTFHKGAFKKRLISSVGKHIKCQNRLVGTTRKSVLYYQQDKISSSPLRPESLWRLHRFLSKGTAILSLGYEAEHATEVSNERSYTFPGVALN